MALQLLKAKHVVGKAPKYVIALNGRAMSSHRTLSGAKKKFENLKKKAKA